MTLYKELAYFPVSGESEFDPDQSQANLDHVAGLRNMADKSEELATKAAKAAVFVARGIYETEVGMRCVRTCLKLLYLKVVYLFRTLSGEL